MPCGWCVFLSRCFEFFSLEKMTCFSISSDSGCCKPKKEKQAEQADYLQGCSFHYASQLATRLCETISSYN
jgi:hypothetical protein